MEHLQTQTLTALARQRGGGDSVCRRSPRKRPDTPGTSGALNGQAAFSLLELLVILAIVAILAVGSTFMLTNKQSGAVRSLLNDIEGSIANAYQAANAGSRDTALACWGNWDRATPMVMAFGDARVLLPPGSETLFTTTANQILAGNPPTDTTTAPGGLTPADLQTIQVAFNYTYTDTIQRKAKVVIDESDWGLASGDSVDITTVPPFNATGEFSGVLADPTNNLCRNDFAWVGINGYTKRFTSTVYIKVVTTNSAGGPVKNAPMGLIVLRENSPTIFKFYNPGTEGGDGKWRRL